MKHFLGIFLVSITLTSCFSQEETTCAKNFPSIALINKIEFKTSSDDQNKMACAFLVKHNNDTFAVTAKHILLIAKTEGMNRLDISKHVKKWSMRPLNQETEYIIVDSLLNTNVREKLEKGEVMKHDWMLFSIKENHSPVKPLELRTTPLNPGEKVYVIGWLRDMTDGAQRVYEFEYYKSIGPRLLLKEVIAPSKFGGLSGGPVVDAEGKVVGIVSNSSEDPDTGKNYFSPFSIEEIKTFMEKLPAK